MTNSARQLKLRANPSGPTRPAQLPVRRSALKAALMAIAFPLVPVGCSSDDRPPPGNIDRLPGPDAVTAGELCDNFFATWCRRTVTDCNFGTWGPTEMACFNQLRPTCCDGLCDRALDATEAEVNACYDSLEEATCPYFSGTGNVPAECREFPLF